MDIELFSEQFKDAYGKIMHEDFPGQEAGVHLGIFRELISHMTSGLVTLKKGQYAKNVELQKVDSEVTKLKRAIGGTREDQGLQGKSILDHKAIMNLKPFGNDKTSFKLWYEKLVNAFEAAIKGSTTLFEVATSEIDQGAMSR